MRTLDGKVVVIMGAGSGIGRALALAADARGAVLALSDQDVTGLAETARLVRAASGRVVRTDRLDVRDREALREYAAAVRRDLGAVNVVVNNAGVALYGDFTDVGYEDFEWVMDVDFWGVVNGSKEFLPHLVESGDGHLVNVSSLFGLVAMPGHTAYNAAKFAVRGFTEALRMELLRDGHPVRVTCVHPGGVRTAIARNARVAGSVDKGRVAREFDARWARMSPERAAEVILDGVLAGRPRVLVGADARLLDWFARLTGAGYQWVLIRGDRRPRAAPPT